MMNVVCANFLQSKFFSINIFEYHFTLVVYNMKTLCVPIQCKYTYCYKVTNRWTTSSKILFCYEITLAI